MRKAAEYVLVAGLALLPLTCSTCPAEAAETKKHSVTLDAGVSVNNDINTQGRGRFDFRNFDGNTGYSFGATYHWHLNGTGNSGWRFGTGISHFSMSGDDAGPRIDKWTLGNTTLYSSVGYDHYFKSGFFGGGSIRMGSTLVRPTARERSGKEIQKASDIIPSFGLELKAGYRLRSGVELFIKADQWSPLNEPRIDVATEFFGLSNQHIKVGVTLPF